MKRIRVTDYARIKMEILKSHGFDTSEPMVKEIIASPDKIEPGYRGRWIAQKGLDETHVLRNVYEDNPDEMVVITLYPGRRKRYDKNQI